MKTPPLNPYPIRVLVADDNPDDLDLLRIAFAKTEAIWDCVMVSSGKEALRRLTECGEGAERIDVAVLDVQMPDMNGIDVLEAVKANPNARALPIIMLSTSTRQADVRRAYECGAQAYYVKPDDLSSLVRLIAMLATLLTSYQALPKRWRPQEAA